MSSDLLAGLPGEAMARQGLADLAANRTTVEACLAEIARPRLWRAGLLATATPVIAEAEHRLYALLREHGGDAYSRYNGLLRELASFEAALDARLSRAERAAEPRS